MVRDGLLVAGKDLRIELRSRVLSNQLVPFAVLVLVLFAFALDPDSGVLETATPGLFWVSVLFCSVLAIGRSAAIEGTGGVADHLRLAGIEPAALFLGKAVAVAVQLLVLEVVLGVGVVVFYGASPAGWLLLAATCLPATAGIAAAGTLYGVLSVGVRVRDTLLPLLLLPVLAPVLIGATRASEAALRGMPSEGWPWAGLLGVFALGYIAAGAVAFGPMLEES
jgi:heme exporter protein B